MKTLPKPGLLPMLRAFLTWRRKSQGALDTQPQRYAVPPLDAAHLGRFRQALGYPDSREQVPLCYHYLLVQRAQLDMMLAPAFPHAVVGLVHAGQQWTVHRHWQPELPGEMELQMAAGRHALAFRISARLWQQQAFCLETVSDYRVLERSALRRPPPAGRASPAPAGPQIERWLLPADAGRRHALLSGDWNPIHLWPWSARLFGMEQPIIHGLHTAARAEAGLQRQLGRPLQQLSLQFRRPLALPGEARLHLDGGSFSVSSPAGTVASGQCG
jgi:hypothetical protein